MQVRYPEIGICGVSCRLCPDRYSSYRNACNGCKGEQRVDITCPLRTCAVTKKGIEFSWECQESDSCEILRTALREGCNAAMKYQSAEDNISFIKQNGIEAFDRVQKTRGKLLSEMLHEYDEGCFVQEYCAAASTLEVGEIEAALTQAWINTVGMKLNGKSEYLLSLLHSVSTIKGRSKGLGGEKRKYSGLYSC